MLPSQSQSTGLSYSGLSSGSLAQSLVPTRSPVQRTDSPSPSPSPFVHGSKLGSLRSTPSVSTPFLAFASLPPASPSHDDRSSVVVISPSAPSLAPSAGGEQKTAARSASAASFRPLHAEQRWLGPSVDPGSCFEALGRTFAVGTSRGATCIAAVGATRNCISVYVSPRFVLVQVMAFTGGNESVTALAWSPDCAALAVATSDRSVLLYVRTHIGAVRLEWSLYEDRYGEKRCYSAPFDITALAFRPSDGALLIGGAAGELQLYECPVARPWRQQAAQFRQQSSSSSSSSQRAAAASAPAQRQYQLLWQRRADDASYLPRRPISALSASADGAMFSSVSGRHISVWFERPATSYAAALDRVERLAQASSSSLSSVSAAVPKLREQLTRRLNKPAYEFCLLPHPVSMDDGQHSWMPPFTQSYGAAASRRLISFASDGLLRLWAEQSTMPHSLPSFHLVFVLDARRLDALAFSWLCPQPGQEYPYSDESFAAFRAQSTLPNNNNNHHHHHHLAAAGPSDFVGANLLNGSPYDDAAAQSHDAGAMLVAVHADGSSSIYQLVGGERFALRQRSEQIFQTCLSTLPPAAPAFLFAERRSLSSGSSSTLFDRVDLFLCSAGRCLHTGASGQSMAIKTDSLRFMKTTTTIGRPFADRRIVDIQAAPHDLVAHFTVFAVVYEPPTPPLLWLVADAAATGFPFIYHVLAPAELAGASVLAAQWGPCATLYLSCSDAHVYFFHVRLGESHPVPQLTFLFRLATYTAPSTATTDDSESFSFASPTPLHSLVTVALHDFTAVLPTTFLCQHSATFVVVGLSPDGQSLAVSDQLRVVHPPQSAQPDAAQHCLRIVRSFSYADLATSISASHTPGAPIAFFTGHVDGAVRVWQIAAADADAAVALRELNNQFRSGSSAIDTLTAAYFGRVAVCSRNEGVLRVWQLESSTPAFELEWESATLTGAPAAPSVLRASTVALPTLDSGASAAPADDEVFVDWLVLPNHTLVLVLALSRSFYVLGQHYGHRFEPAEGNDATVTWRTWGRWAIDPALYGSVTGVRWTRDGGVLLVCGSASLYYPASYLLNSATPLASKRALNYPLSMGATLPHAFVGHAYSPLPFYHPAVVLRHIIGNNTHLLRQLFDRLNAEISRHRDAVVKQGASFQLPLFLPSPPLDQWLELVARDQASAASTAVDSAGQRSEDVVAQLLAPTTDDALLAGPRSLSSSSLLSAAAAASSDGSQMLSDVPLFRLSRPEQMILMAAVSAFTQSQTQDQGIDPCGTRFLVALKMNIFMSKVRLDGGSFPLVSSDFAWALQSEAHASLVQSCWAGKGTSWETARETGMGYWLRSHTELKKAVEAIAQAAYLKDKEPADCSLWYVVLDKRRALAALYKRKGDPASLRLADFLNRDPSLPENRRVAGSNAFDLLAKRRYQLSLAFFLLAGSLKDVVHLCITKLHDPQLAVVLMRLVTGSDASDAVVDVYNKHVIPLAVETKDSWLHHIALWNLRQYEPSFNVMLPVDQQESTGSWDPSSLDFLHFLSKSTIVRNARVDDHRMRLLRRRIAYCYVNGRSPAFAFLQYQLLQRFEQEAASAAEQQATEQQADNEPSKSDRAEDLLGGASRGGDRAEDLFGGGRGSDRAEDLFSSRTSTTDRAEDLFGGGRTTTTDRASDLFGSSSSGSRASDLFGGSSSSSRASDLFGGSSSTFSAPAVPSFNAFSFQYDDDEDKDNAEEEKADAEPAVVRHDCTADLVAAIDRHQEDLICFALASQIVFEAEILSRLPAVPPNFADEPVGQTLSVFASTERSLSALLTSFDSAFGLPAKEILSWLGSFCDQLGFVRCAHWIKFHCAGAPPANFGDSVEHFRYHLLTLKETVVSKFCTLPWTPTFVSLAEACAALSTCVDLLETLPLFASDPIITEFFSNDLVFATRLLSFMVCYEFQQWSLAPLFFRPNEQATLRLLVRHLLHLLDPQPTLLDFDFESLAGEELASNTVSLQGLERKASLSRPRLLDYWEYSIMSALCLLLSAEIVCYDSAGARMSSSILRFEQNFLATVIVGIECAASEAAGLRFIWELRTSPLQTLSGWVGRAGATSGQDDPQWLAVQSSAKAPPPPTPLSPMRVGRDEALFWTHLLRCYPQGAAFVVGRALQRWTPFPRDWRAARSSHFKIDTTDSRAIVPSAKQLQSRSIAEAASLMDPANPQFVLQQQQRKLEHDLSASTLATVSTVSSTAKTLAFSPSETLVLQAAQEHAAEVAENFTGFRVKGIIHAMSSADKTVLAATTVGVHELVPVESADSRKLAFRCVGKMPTVVQSLSLHPNRPLYTIGGTSGEVVLYPTSYHARLSWGDCPAPLSPGELAAPVKVLRKEFAPGTHRVNEVRFNATGSLLGAVDRTGHFALWHVESSLNGGAAGGIVNPYVNTAVHSKQACDFCFLDDAGLTATVGVHKSGADVPNLSVWDWSLPPHKASVFSFARSELFSSGASSVAYAPARRWIVAGGRTGVLCAFDLRNPHQVLSTAVHNINIRSVAVHPSERVLVTGSSDGSVVALDLPSFQPIGCWVNAHSRSTFVSAPNSTGIFESTISTIGTTDVRCYDQSWILSCGSDGRIDTKEIFLSLGRH